MHRDAGDKGWIDGDNGHNRITTSLFTEMLWTF